MRRIALVVAVTGLVAVAATVHGQARPESGSGSPRTYLVLYAKGVPISAARGAILRAGGSILLENRHEEVATVRSADANFVTDVAASRAILGATVEVSVRSPALVVLRLSALAPR